MIDIIEYKVPQQLLDNSEDFMLERETENNLVLGLTSMLAIRDPLIGDELLFGLEKNGKTVGVAIRTEIDKPLAITKMCVESISVLVNHLVSSNIAIRGVVGEEVTSEHFASFYCEKYKVDRKLNMHQGVYELHELNLPDLNDCSLVSVDSSHIVIIETMLKGFIVECFGSDEGTANRYSDMAKRHIKNKTLFLLKDRNGEIVSCAANVRQTVNSGCVSLVYTPPEHRGKGYGSLVTGHVSKDILEKGKKFCNLFTDLSNPTSNSIYKKLGYEMIGKSKHFDFIEK